MDKYLELLKNCPLFCGIENSELQSLLSCLSAVQRKYDKNSFIFSAGDAATSVGVVLSGGVHVLQEDYWGNRTILAHIEPGGLFGEAFSCADSDSLPVSVIVAESSKILLIDYKKIITTCSSACTFHMLLIKNMLSILARKNIMLTQKMEIIAHRTTRERLLAYLSAQAIKSGNNRFVIPFDRQQLANFLSVDRSAMSAEISRMQKSGLLRTTKSEFELLI